MRDPNNENNVLFYIKTLDDVGIKALENKDLDGILKLTNFNFCKGYVRHLDLFN